MCSPMPTRPPAASPASHSKLLTWQSAAGADRQVRFELGLLAQREAVLEILGHQLHQFFAAGVVRTSHGVPLTYR